MENVSEPPLTSDQIAVLRFYRRAAIRALAQIRHPIVRHPNGSTAYPLWPLAKFAVADESVNPPAAPDEVAEAVIGLCNYQQFRGIEVNVLIDLIAAGIVNFATRKAEVSDDRSIHWRIYAARVTAALDHLRKTAANNAGLTAHSGKIGSLADVANGNVLSRIERIGAGQTSQPPDPNAVNAWRSANPVPQLQPFTDVKNMVLKPPPR